MATPTRIVRTFTETASTVPAVRIVRAFDCLVDSLQSAGYEGILVIDDETLGPAIECSYRGTRHIVLVLLVPLVRYERKTRELDAYVRRLLDNEDDRETLAREVAGASLDVAQVVINRATQHVSIHHLVDVLRTQKTRPKNMRFLVPRGNGRPVHICEDLYAGREDGASPSDL